LWIQRSQDQHLATVGAEVLRVVVLAVVKDWREIYHLASPATNIGDRDGLELEPDWHCASFGFAPTKISARLA
jgi:hypothetical protein